MAWLAALGALALPATARADVLVSNIEQVTPAGVQLETLQTPRGLQFTTGDNVDGYDLENIELKVDEYENARVTVELYSVVSGNPGSSLFEFDNPASGITANAVNRFAAPANITLKGSNTIYMIVVTGANDPDASSNKFSLSYTIEDAEDQGGATNSEGDADWAIQDTGHFSVAGVWHTAARPMQIRVNGAAVTTPERALALVSNLEEGGHADVQISEPHAQAFTTGSNAAGYTLTGVAVVAAATTTATAMTAQVCATDGSAHPTTPCTDLAVPASFDPGTVSLAAPANTTLANDTTYAVVLRDSPEMTYTGQNSQAAAHAGWSIANTALAFHAGSSEWRLQSNTWSFRMAIQGYATPLVSNIAQADTSATATDVPRSQGFTTGLNAAGYTLTGVDIVSTVAASSTLFAVAVCETDTSGHPTATCTDFTAPDGHAAGRVAFAAPAAITTLAHDTTYAVVVRGGEEVGATTSTDEDPGGAAAWRIADRFASYDDVADAWQDSAGDESLRIAIPGHVAAGTGCTPDTAAGDIWCGVVTVAELKAPADVTIGYGFSETQGGGLPETMFPVGGNRYTIAGVAVGAGGGSGRLSFALKTALPDADRAKLVLHVDGVSRPFAFDDNQTTTGAAAGYLWASRTGLDWSSASTVTLRLRPRTLGIGDARAPEADDMTFAATLSATSTAPVTAIWTASIGSGDTAVLADLGTTTTGMVNVPVGATTTTFTVATAEDGAVEPDETFTVTLSDVSSNATLRTATATGTITNDDNATLSIADAEGGEDEGVEFELTLSAAAQEDVTVDWTASIGSGDTAVAADLGATTTDMVVVPAGATTTTFTVAVNDDNIHEDDETFTVTLSNPTPASLAQLAADPAATGTIDDNESPPVVSFEQASYTAAEGGPAVEVGLTMTSALPDLVYVTLTAEHGAGATAEDYDGIGPGARAIFLAGGTRSIFDVTAFDDDLDEADETVTLGFTIPAAFSGLTQGSVSETTLTLTDNDEPPTVTVADGAATEGDAVEFVATLSAASGLEVTVNYATSVGTDQTATSGTDFTAAPSGTLTIDAGDGAGTISIDTATDDDDEGAETFTLTISSPTNATLGTQTAATGTIEDPVPVTLPTLSVADAAGTEADGVQFTATLSEAGTEQVTATWTASISGGDTAVAADLGATTTAMVVVPAGATTTTFTVATADDADAETDETFTVTLSAPSSNAELADATATGTIVDDDADTALVGIAVNGVGIPGFFADDDAPQHGVPAATSTAAVLATAASPSAVVAYSGADADASTADLHDVDLADGANTVTVTVTDKGETATWDLGVNRAVTAAYGWKADSDFDTLKLAGIGDPRGIWYDEDTATFYVGDFGDGKVYAFNPDGTRDAGKDFDVSSFPNGIWSDGTTLWVADSSVEKLRAYTLAGVRDADEDFDTLAAADNEDPRDLWSDGTTMWVADKDDAKIYAYKVSDKSRDADNDFDTLEAAGNEAPFGIFSDGATMWVSDKEDGKVYAYKVSDKTRDADKDFDTLAGAGNDNPRALWSHGSVLWTTDDDDDKLYAYNLASTDLSGIEVNGVGIPGFLAGDAAPQHGVPAATSTAAVVATAKSPSADVSYSPADADTSTADVHDANLADGANTVTITVTNGGASADYALGVNRAVTDAYGWKADSDFDTLKLAGIGDPRGIWYDEDTATFYVGDFGDGKVYAFNPDGTRDAGKDFDVSSFPNGIWSDGTTLWVADSSVEKLRAYTLAGVRDADEDFDTLVAADNEDPRDLWSDGTTMWVADKDDAKIYAYKVSDKSRDADEDFDTLDAAGNDSPRAIWSDGTTMWVADSADAKVYAYKVSDQSRDSDKDFDTLAGAGNDNPRALWSHGTVLWTSDDDDDKLYAYNLPAASTPPPVNNAPVFDSSSTFGADENQRTAGTVRASDGDSGDDVTGYAITGGADQGRFSIGSTSGVLTFASAPDYEDPDDADADGSYLVTVEAASGTGAREMTATQTITVTVDDVDEQPDTPASPTLQPVTGSTTSLAASWEKPGLNGGPDITDYDVRYREGTSGGWTDLAHNGTGRTATVGGLTADTAYQAQVRADNGERESDWSDASDAVRTNPEAEATAPDAPRNLTATAAGETRIDLDWDAPADDGGAAVTGYRIEVSVDAGASFAELAATGGSVTRYAHTGLSAGETRHYRVVAVNAEGDSPASAIAGAATDEEREPAGNEPSVIRTYWIGSGGSNGKSGCAGTEEFRAYWNPPQKNQGNNRTYKVADAWEADVTLSGGASGLAYTIQNTGGDPERPELTGSVRIDGNGYVSMRVRGRFGADGWGGWSPTSSLYCRAAAPGAWVDGALLGLTWATPRDGFAAPDGGDFAVRVDGAPVAVTDAALAGAHALLTLAAPVLAGQSVAVDYLASAMHPLADTAGVPVPAWTDLAVENRTGAPADAAWAAVPGLAEALRSVPPALRAPTGPALDPGSLSLAGAGLTDAGLAALFSRGDPRVDAPGAPTEAFVRFPADLFDLAGLRRLDLSGNVLADLSALAGRGGLASLDLSGNALADLAPLSTLTGLRRLDLRGNRIADLAPLASLPRLEVLLLDGNRIADVGALTHLGTLQHLGLSDNAVVDLAPLSDLWSLRRLDVGGNPARDLSPLGDLGTLEWLRAPAANGGVPAHRLIRLRWLWTGPAGVCLGCAEEHEAR